MTNSNYLLFVASVIPLAAGAQVRSNVTNSANAKESLNVVMILTDDHAFQALSAYGHPISKLAPTPNLDRIAKMGVTFTNATVENSISAPSRATILTGLYSHQHGQTTLAKGLKPEKEFFSEILQRAGYQTALFGKWHLQVDPKGFDTYEVLQDQGEYYNPIFRTSDSEGKFTKKEGYATNIITEEAISWLSARDTEKPFCLLVWHKAPHRNWMPDIQYLNLYNDVIFPEPVNLFEDYADSGPQMRSQELTISKHMGYAFDFHVRQLADEPTLEYIKKSFPTATSSLNVQQLEAWNKAYDRQNAEFLKNRPQGDDLVRWKYQRYIRDYCRTIHSVDVQTGLLLDYLEREGLTENTIIVYMSDQGFFLGEHGVYDKRLIYQEGFRTPLLIAYPGGVKGRKCDELVQNIDIAPTFVAAAGLRAPDYMVGDNLEPLLTGNNRDWNREYLYYQYYDYPSVGMVRKHYGISDGRYKLIHWYGKGFKSKKPLTWYENPSLKGDADVDWWELFDLKSDPNEMHNVYNRPKYAEVQKRLNTALKAKREEINVIE